jgi:hypothetical protein
MIVEIPPFCDHRVFVKTLQNSLNCQKIAGITPDSTTSDALLFSSESQRINQFAIDLAFYLYIPCAEGKYSLRAFFRMTASKASAGL